MVSTSPSENKTIVRRVPEEIVNEQKVDLADELFDEGFVDHNALLGEVTGLQSYKESIHGILAAFPDLHVAPEDMVAEDDRVATRFTLSGTHEGEFLGVPATGAEVEYQAQTIFQLAEGKIVERWVTPDIHTLLVQMDAIPSLEEM